MFTTFMGLTSSIKTRLRQHHDLYPSIPVKAEYWESALVGAIKDQQPKLKPTWTCGSQQIGRDVTLSNGVEVSCKSGQVHGGKTIKISSSSLSRFGDDTAMMREYLRTTKTDDFILCLSTFKSPSKAFDGRYLYSIFDSRVVNYDDMEWEVFGKDNNVRGTNADGISLTITKAMGWQVWYYLPTKLALASEPIKINVVEGPGAEFFSFP